jgi:hypothetical protein
MHMRNPSWARGIAIFARRHHNNAYFARVGGVEVAEMNALELRLLFALYCAALECHVDTPDAGGPVPRMPPSSHVDGEEAVTSSKDKVAAAGGGSVVVQRSHRQRRAVVQIMTTAQ